MIPRVAAVFVLLGSALAQNVVHYTTTTANANAALATRKPILEIQPRCCAEFAMIASLLNANHPTSPAQDVKGTFGLLQGTGSGRVLMD